jgi:hypothetical protein
MKHRTHCPFHNSLLTKSESYPFYNCECDCGWSKNERTLSYRCDDCFKQYCSFSSDEPCYMGFTKISRPNHEPKILLPRLGNKFIANEHIIFANNSSSLHIEYGTLGTNIIFFKVNSGMVGKQYVGSNFVNCGRLLLTAADINEHYKYAKLLAFS